MRFLEDEFEERRTRTREREKRKPKGTAKFSIETK
jgi:hypothetical protein